MPRAATAHSRVIKEAMGIKGFILAYNPFRVVDRVGEYRHGCGRQQEMQVDVLALCLIEC